MNNEVLIQKAKEAMEYAYACYSNFKVGAALLTKSGKVYNGCNIENASFGATICAERVAYSKAISEGEKQFEKIAIVSSRGVFTYPCGICRQFMSEFGTDIEIVVENGSEIKVCTLHELLPNAFISF